MSNIPNKTKPEPMSAGMNGQQYVEIKKAIDDSDFREGVRAELKRVLEDVVLEHGTQKAEIDRLSTALVAANAEIVTEREKVADLLRWRITSDAPTVKGRSNSDSNSDAPAKAGTGPARCETERQHGKCAGCWHCGRFDGRAEVIKWLRDPENASGDRATYYLSAADLLENPRAEPTGPASKPLVVTPLSLGAELRSVLNRHSAENASNTPDFILADALVTTLDVLARAINDRDMWYGVKLAPGQVRNPVVIPSAKADEGKANKWAGEPRTWHQVDDGAFAMPFGTIRKCIDCGCLVAGGPTRCLRCADPAPPALTREDVVEMFVRYHQWKLGGEYFATPPDYEGLRSALSDGGAK